MSEERKVLSRWSERKAAARRGDLPPEPADEALPPAATPDEAAPADDVAASADEEMPVLPSIDELTAESDYTVFLGEKVPEQLRRAALRKLWTSDPVFATLDGLNDYDEDYNLATTVIGAVQSAWQAGRGYAEEVEEKIDKVEEALDGSAGVQDEPQPDESQATFEPVHVSQADDALGESDAAGDNSADAPRRVAKVAPDGLPKHRSK
ncbi:MAG: DUF3306 domain-containing protein [Pseudolabrys sp.]